MQLDTTKLFQGLMEYSRFSLIPTEKAFLLYCKARKLEYSRDEIHKYLVRTKRIGHIVVFNRLKFSYLKTHQKARNYYKRYRYLSALNLRKQSKFNGFRVIIKIRNKQYIFIKHIIITKLDQHEYKVKFLSKHHFKLYKKKK